MRFVRLQIMEVEPYSIALGLKSRHLVFQKYARIAEVGELSPQGRLKIGLVKSIARITTLGSDALWTRPIKEQSALSIDEAHARVDHSLACHFLGNSDGLKNAHHLAVEMTGPGLMMHRGRTLDDCHAQVFLGEQVGERCTHGAVAHNRNVHVFQRRSQ